MPQENIAKMEQRLNALKKDSQALTNANVYDQLLQIIHKPGWTTVAESLFLENTLDLISAQMQSLTRAQQGLLEAANAVGTQQAAATTTNR